MQNGANNQDLQDKKEALKWENEGSADREKRGRLLQEKEGLQEEKRGVGFQEIQKVDSGKENE